MHKDACTHSGRETTSDKQKDLLTDGRTYRGEFTQLIKNDFSANRIPMRTTVCEGSSNHSLKLLPNYVAFPTLIRGCVSIWSTPFFVYKNHAYKNVEAQITPKVKNIVVIFLVAISISFPASDEI